MPRPPSTSVSAASSMLMRQPSPSSISECGCNLITQPFEPQGRLIQTQIQRPGGECEKDQQCEFDRERGPKGTPPPSAATLCTSAPRPPQRALWQMPELLPVAQSVFPYPCPVRVTLPCAISPAGVHALIRIACADATLACRCDPRDAQWRIKARSSTATT